MIINFSCKELDKLDSELLTEKVLKLNCLYSKAWVYSVSPVFLEVRVDDQKPDDLDQFVLKTQKSQRKTMDDENEKSSKKDTLWGDSKLAIKKTMRFINHEADHNQKIKTQLKDSNINLNISCDTDGVLVGDFITFKIDKIWNPILNQRSYGSVIGTILEHEPISDRSLDYLLLKITENRKKEKLKQFKRMFFYISIAILSSLIFLYKN